MFPCRALAVASAALALVVLAHPVRAQNAAGADDSTAVCLRFGFGSWSPPLDWKAAKHQGPLDSSWVGHAPGGRGWAAHDDASTDSTLMLFPGWWPVGVAVALPTRTPARGDTVTGVATALVADGRVRNPTARVRAWRVPCGESSHAGTAKPQRDSSVRE